MVVLGLLLILCGAVAVLAAVVTAHGTVQLLGLDVSGLTLFFVGVAAAVAIQWGLVFLRFGARRSLKQRRERRELARLSSKHGRGPDAERHDEPGTTTD